jgi:hypothetical protein
MNLRYGACRPLAGASPSRRGDLIQDQRLPFARLTHRRLGLHAYFEAADRALARLVPYDAACWLSLDQATLLPTSHFSRVHNLEQLLQIAANEYLETDANRFADLARAARPVGTLHEATGGCPSGARATCRS